MTPKSGSKPNWPADRTAGGVRRRLANRFAASRPDDAPALADWLLAELLQVRRSELPRQSTLPLDDGQLARLEAWADSIERQQPLQHILGYADFRGRRFCSDRRALIPRPETEELVEAILRANPPADAGGPSMHFIDVGTGSGCIAVTLALERPAARVTALDLSADALALARENADRHGVGKGIEWVHADIRELDPAAVATGSGAVAVVSNPPYIPTAALAALEPCVRDHEPIAALDGGSDGLDAIRAVVDWAERIDGKPVELFLEIGFDQAGAVRDHLGNGGWRDIRIRRDMGGHDRIVSAARGLARL